MHQKLVPDSFFILVNNPKRYLKWEYQKPLKKLILFLSNPVPFNGQSYKKQKGLGTSDHSLFTLQNKFKKKLFISYLLSDQV